MRVEVGNLTKKIPYSQSVRALERKWWICDGQNQCGNSRLPSYSPTHSQSWTKKTVRLDLRDPIFRGPICLEISWRRCIKCPGWIRSNRQINYGENLTHAQADDHHGTGVKTNDSPGSSTITRITITVTTERGVTGMAGTIITPMGGIRNPALSLFLSLRVSAEWKGYKH